MRYDANVDLHGFNLERTTLCTYPTRKWMSEATRLGLRDEAWSLAALTVLEKHQQAWTSKSPHKYMSGFIGSRLRVLIAKHKRRDHLSLDKPVGDKKRPFGTTLTAREPRPTFDPFDLVPEYRREFVRDYYYMTHGDTRAKGFKDFCEKHKISKEAAYVRLEDAINQLREKYAQ